MSKKKVSKKVEDKKEEIKTFYRIERKNGGWTLVTIAINESGQMVFSIDTVEDVLSNILYKLERKIRREHGL